MGIQFADGLAGVAAAARPSPPPALFFLESGALPFKSETIFRVNKRHQVPPGPREEDR